ncbi:MAG: nitroreductase family protein [Christensenellaceae bacterium]|jgi:nitroreductase|nr:nitroreductase family protein [Christensenellaceae bacterium]
MDFKALATKRYSVRKFSREPVTAAELQAVLLAGRIAPTAANRQPQRVLVLTEEEGLKKLDACTSCRFGAPAALIVFFDRDAPWARPFDGERSGWVDASIVTDHMMMQAADLGLGSTWVMHFDPAKVMELFQVPETLVPVAVLPLGHPAADAEPSDRHALRLGETETIFYNGF